LIALKNIVTTPEKDQTIETFMKQFEDRNNTLLSDEQKQAVLKIFTTTDIIVITGYPGSGKSTITNCIKEIYGELHKASGDEIVFAAPTGIAANKLNNGKGMTLHRALQVLVGRNGKFTFQRNATNPFPNKLIIVDEFSMVDIDIAYYLFDSIVPGQTKLIIIGDHNQLPSVGPGDILRHIIASASIPVIRLTKIFRQKNNASLNHIFEFAKMVNRGKMPTSEQINNENIKFFNIENSEQIYQAILKLFIKHNKNCQILFGTRKETTVGSIQGNKVIAAHLHPELKNNDEFIGCFRKGDKIICNKNSVITDENGEVIIQSSIFNGESGIISAIDKKLNKILFQSDTKKVKVNTDMIEHGWCVTVNKSQGSEYDNVVVVLHPSQSLMLNRQVLYTAATRAKKNLYIIGTSSTLKQAISTPAPQRYSLLSSIIVSVEQNEDDV